MLAGIGKLVFVKDLIAFLFQPFQGATPYLAGLICLVEFTLGTMLLVMKPARILLLCALCLFGIYTLLALVLGILDLEVPGGFGAFDGGRGPFLVVLRNSVYLVITLYALIKVDKNQKMQMPFLYPVMFATMVYAFLLGSVIHPLETSYSQRKTEGDHLQRGSVTGYLAGERGLEFDPGRKYLIFIFTPGCDHCINSLEHVKMYGEYGLVDEIIGISKQEFDKVDREFRDLFGVDFPVLTLEDEAFHLLTHALPTAIITEGAEIKETINGFIPSPFIHYNLKNQEP